MPATSAGIRYGNLVDTDRKTRQGEEGLGLRHAEVSSDIHECVGSIERGELGRERGAPLLAKRVRAGRGSNLCHEGECAGRMARCKGLGDRRHGNRPRFAPLFLR